MRWGSTSCSCSSQASGPSSACCLSRAASSCFARHSQASFLRTRVCVHLRACMPVHPHTRVHTRTYMHRHARAHMLAGRGAHACRLRLSNKLKTHTGMRERLCAALPDALAICVHPCGAGANARLRACSDAFHRWRPRRVIRISRFCSTRRLRMCTRMHGCTHGDDVHRDSNAGGIAMAMESEYFAASGAPPHLAMAHLVRRRGTKDVSDICPWFRSSTLDSRPQVSLSATSSRNSTSIP